MSDLSVSPAILGIIEYAVGKGLLDTADRNWALNAILGVLRLDSPGADAVPAALPLDELLKALADDAAARGVIQNTAASRDLLDTAVMGCVTPRPSELAERFASLYGKSPKDATDWFYRLCMDCNYIREYRLKKDVKWSYTSKYGTMEITINLAKPEKDPLDIAAARSAKKIAYPACQLCRENEGYAGRTDYPARQNLRIIPIDILGEPWGFQYSPYVYYNEHCIVLNSAHTPMVIDTACFRKLFDFLDKFPHYFIGSNADLPIVGGSILSHEHFQGGRHEFPIEKAKTTEQIPLPCCTGVSCGILNWPMAAIRLNGADSGKVARLADAIFEAWKDYDDPEAHIFSKTGGERHNTVTPIARKRGALYEMDIVLRNNRTTKEHPLGLFHPHSELHHIKKENIGLIEVMGLAILPPHLKNELQALGEAMASGGDLRSNELSLHAEWAEEILSRRKVTARNVDDILRDEVGAVFVKCLEHAGVFGQDEKGKAAFDRFTKTFFSRVSEISIG
ncbi:MAG: UDP-glucose--hexose-1-phosphate uridylyltransferase [Oscillospiraceae bacterium]|nr:UDP-glucose--hexose-1-phosphate uridylyltransferase [Oscillospiraceae bacterium]